MAVRAGLFTLIACFAATSAVAQENGPLSAIDWLSDSVTSEAPPTTERVGAPIAAMPLEIRVMPLDAPVPDAAGLLDPSDLGLNPGIWGRSSAADLARELASLRDMPDAPPALRRFVIDLISARLTPPIDAAIDDSFFLARLDRLLASGHLTEAAALVDEAGATEPKSFRRVFDIALLTGQETDACRIIEETPDLSPTYPARIFCLARLGKWDVAALTLGNAETLDILSPREDALLLSFLDPELFNDPLPPAPSRPSPLMFRLYEAVGERISTDQLPVAFAAADLGNTVGWKTRLRAAERLTAAGAMPFDAMLKVFRERKPAASGSVWDRVGAVQAVADAVDRSNKAQIERHLSNAWAAARNAGYGASFAAWIAPELNGIKLKGPTQHLAFEIALLAGQPDLAAQFANTSDEDQFLLTLIQGQRGARPGADPLGRAVLRGLSALSAGSTYQALIRDDRPGEALLRALAQLSEGAAGNPDATAHSLTLLRKLGLEDLARQIAVELVLMEGAA